MQFSFTTMVKLSLALMLGAGILLPQSSSADVTKANNSTALTNGGSWVLGVAPGPGDVAIFDSTLKLNTFANSITPAPLGGNLSILGIRVAGPVLGQANGENGICITNALSANKLTIGISGIDLSATNAVPLNIQSKIALSGSQTWNISDASARITNPVPVLPLPATQNHGNRYTAFLANEDEDLYFNTSVAGTSFDLGGFTLTLTNSGTTVIDQGYTVGNGVINVNQGTLVIQGGKSRQTTVSNNVSINVASGATLRLQTTSGAIVSSAAISLANGSLLNLTAAGTQGTGAVSNSITVSGNATLSQTQNPIVGGDNSITNIVAANITGASGTTLNLLPTQSGAGTCVLQLSGDNSGFNGTFNINAVSGIRPVRLSSATAGSANATWTVNAGNILQVAGVTVRLGTLNGAGTISNSITATTATINVGAGNFSGTIANAGTAVMSLNKITSSTLTLGGTDTYTGATAISNGTLLVNGSITSPVTVYSGGTLGGIGTIRSNLLANAGSTVAPGNPNSIGTLTVSGTITNGGTILMKLNRSNSPTSDLLSSAKTITITGGATLTVTNLGPVLQVGDTFTLFSATSYSGLLGLLNSTNLPSLPAGLAWNTSGLTNNGTISVVALPAITSLTPLNPSVQCPGNLTFTVTAMGQSPLSYQWSVNGSPVNGQTATNFSLSNIHFPGPITVSVTVSNAYGPVTSNSVVTVQDTAAPVITLNGANPLTVECHGSFSDLGATANDACAGSVGVRVSGSVDANTAGTYYLTYTSDDGNSNTNSVVRTVNVVDTTPPVITYYFTNLVLSADANCSALMPDVTGTNYIIASDACSGTNLAITQVPTNNVVLPEGTNTVIIAVADQSGNSVYSTNTIVVLDETAPVVALNGPASMTVECHGSYVELGATATDNCTLAGLSTNGVVDANSPGIYTITYVAVDAAGNSATNTRTVTVVDSTAPVVNLNGSSPMTNWLGTVFIDPGATAFDLCAGVLPVTTNGVVNTAVPGTYFVQYIATDPANNSATNTRTVYVVTPVPPVISGGTMLDGGNFQLTFSGPEGQPYKVMTTTDLTQPGSWTVISTGVFGAVPAVFTDTNAPSHPARFYRVVSP
jgi:autotransporter-associated beta strand protein